MGFLSDIIGGIWRNRPLRVCVGKKIWWSDYGHVAIQRDNCIYRNGFSWRDNHGGIHLHRDGFCRISGNV